MASNAHNTEDSAAIVTGPATLVTETQGAPRGVVETGTREQETTDPSAPSTSASPPPADKTITEPATQPATSQPSDSQGLMAAPPSGAGGVSSSSSVGPEEGEAGITLSLTLLLGSGARHPFKIDAKYLQKRSVNVPNNDPYGMSVYTLKELILKEWRSEWEPRPASPSMIRLISLGKLLDDKSALSETRLNREAPNVIHMTVKPPEVAEEEESKVAKSSHGRDREAGQGSTTCRCVIL